MTTTSIEWCAGDDGTPGKSWNCLRGCSQVSPGCTNCYAQRQAARFSGPGLPFEGLVRKTPTGPRWTGVVNTVAGKLADPLRWRDPCRVFVASMSDPFHDDVPNEFIAAMFGVMAACPRHTFILLTKRTERALEWFAWIRDQGEDLHASVGETPPSGSPIPAACALLATAPARLPPGAFNTAAHAPWPLPNVWLLASAEDQPTLEQRVGHLLACPAAVHGISYEPALGPVDFTRIKIVDPKPPHGPGVWLDALRGLVIGPDDVLPNRISWVIVGSESGPGARPAEIDWFRSVAEQCRAADVAWFAKQMHVDGKLCKDVERFPEDLRTREWPHGR